LIALPIIATSWKQATIPTALSIATIALSKSKKWKQLDAD
jgi:hypothetical protein